MTRAVRLLISPIGSKPQLDEGRSPEVVDSSQSEESGYPLEVGSVPLIGSSQALRDGPTEPLVRDADRLGGFFAAESLQRQKAIEVLRQTTIRSILH